MTNKKHLPLDQAAFIARTTTLNLLMHVKRGLLPAEERDGRWFISENDLNDFMSANRKIDPAELCIHHGCSKGCGSCAGE